jgi:hypothetical protein
VREDRGSADLAQGASPVPAQRNDGRLRAALDEFEGVLKIAADDLAEAIDCAVDRPTCFVDHLEENLEKTDADSVTVDRSSIEVARALHDDGEGEIASAFADFGWSISRALRELRKALR